MRFMTNCLNAVTGWEIAIYSSLLLSPVVFLGLCWIGVTSSAAFGLAVAPFFILFFVFLSGALAEPMGWDEDENGDEG